MAIYAVFRSMRSGKLTKKPIVCFEAEDERRARRAFGVGRYWGGFSESTSFVTKQIDAVPKGCNLVSAQDVIDRNSGDEVSW